MKILSNKESTKIAYHNTTKDSQDKILKYGAIASDRGWKGKGFYGYINDGGSEGKGKYQVFFDYSNLKTTDGSKPKEFTDKEWSVSRSDRDKYEKFLKNYDYDAEIDTSSSWIKVFPWSLHKLEFFVKDDIKENKFDTYIETIYEHLLQEKTLTLYHATRAEFDKFSNQYTISQMGIHLGNLEQAENVYEGYVEDYENGDSDKIPKILQVTATIINPLELEDLGSWYGSLVKDMISKKLNKKLSSDRDSYLKKVIIDAGYDSVVYENKFEGDGLSYIIFNPEHINIIKTVKEYKD